MSFTQSSHSGAVSAQRPACAHCGVSCPPAAVRADGRSFCCAGCRTVFELLSERGLEAFYRWEPQPGRTAAAPAEPGRYTFLDSPEVQARLLDFADGETARLRFRLPAIHCVACVWLLERLHKLDPAILAGRVDFPRQTVHLTYDPRKMRPSDLAVLLDRVGYPPDLRLADLRGGVEESGKVSAADRTMWARIGVAGFAFGNTMFMALPGYFGFDQVHGPMFQRWFGWISLAFAVPVATWCAAPYWRSAWVSWRTRRLGLDTPIVLGITALMIQSAVEVVHGGGLAYLDSLTSLIFFLLCGRWFQQRTFDRIAFDRDYRSFFPLAVMRVTEAGEATASLAELKVGDRLRIRHGELIPADARLLRGEAAIDYSFVTGESAPVVCLPGDLLHAGGRQTGGAIEVVTDKPVSQSYLASLWDQDVFQKRPADARESLMDWLGRRFAVAVAATASVSALVWLVIRPEAAAGVFAAVLIVACPCALALAGPFAYGTAQRRLARRGVFVRGPRVLEALARVDSVVLDKTGTLTDTAAAVAVYEGIPLSEEDAAAVTAVAAQSTHPMACAVSRSFPAGSSAVVTDYQEDAGRGIAAVAGGRAVRLGARAWVSPPGAAVAPAKTGDASLTWLSLDGEVVGSFGVRSPLRAGIERLPAKFGDRAITLLSGDHDGDAPRFREWLGPDVVMRFRQTPQDKLEFVKRLSATGSSVMMVGDGLNDAGALQQSDVGVAVVNRAGAFSPASDVVLEAAALPLLPGLLEFSRNLRSSVRTCLRVSLLYNLSGVALAAAGRLSPVVTAVLMPLSSATVVLLACGLATWGERRSLGPLGRRRA